MSVLKLNPCLTWEFPDVKSRHQEPGEDGEAGGCPGEHQEAPRHSEGGAQHGTEV